jgi:hypothetical protein
LAVYWLSIILKVINMTTEQLENKIGMQLMFLLHSNLPIEKCAENLKKIAIDYAEQFKYDFSKNCGCEHPRTGETWCCNQCGLPTTIQSGLNK